MTKQRDPEEYTAIKVWEIMVTDSDLEGDLDERIDVAQGLKQLKHKERVFLVSLAQGYSAQEAMHYAGFSDGMNQTKLKRDVLNRLTKIINGEGKDKHEVLRSK